MNWDHDPPATVRFIANGLTDLTKLVDWKLLGAASSGNHTEANIVLFTVKSLDGTTVYVDAFLNFADI